MFPYVYFINAISKVCQGCGVYLFNSNRFLLILIQDDEEEDFGEDIMKLVNERQEARKSKNFKRADEIRDELAERGITLKDTPQGVQIIRETN